MTALNRITATGFPPQGLHAGRRVQVALGNTVLRGKMRRQDAAYPNVEIIELDDGRMVLGSECKWRGSIDG